MVYIPTGCAHGFYVTSEQATMSYHVTTVYSAEHDAGILWNSAGVPWPTDSPLLSPRDREFPTLGAFDSPFVFEG
jgi:dTDP-4-dehydrorhamnose 3,5-epimerase